MVQYLEKSVAELINRQLDMELENARFYYAAYEYCMVNGAHVFAAFYKEQAQEEMQHYTTSVDHFIKRGHVSLPNNPIKGYSFNVDDTTPEALFLAPLQLAYEREQQTTNAIKEIQSAAEAVNDRTTATWYDSLLMNQIDEEFEFRGLVRMVERILESKNVGVLYSNSIHLPTHAH